MMLRVHVVSCLSLVRNMIVDEQLMGLTAVSYIRCDELPLAVCRINPNLLPCHLAGNNLLFARYPSILILLAVYLPTNLIDTCATLLYIKCTMEHLEPHPQYGLQFQAEAANEESTCGRVRDCAPFSPGRWPTICYISNCHLRPQS